MRKLILVFFLLLACDIAYASQYDFVNHVPRIINGKTFELSGRGEEDVYLKIDGRTASVSKLELQLKNGVWLQLIQIRDMYLNNPLEATIEISMDYTCGNGVCESKESPDICCTDCNCTANYTCVQNQCIKSSLNDCFKDSDCDDNNPCTIETCSGFPLKCKHTAVSICETGDDCCPAICNTTIDYVNNDWDCLPKPACTSDFNCSDGDELTIDLCERHTSTCRFEVMVVKGQKVKDTVELINKPAINTTENLTNLEPVIDSGVSFTEYIYSYKWYLLGGLMSILLILISIKMFKNYKNNINSV